MEEVRIVENLFSGEREAQIEAATEMAKLNSKQRQKLVERGVIKPLILMLYSQDFEAIESALFALLALAFGSERNKKRIVKSGALPPLANLLQFCQSKQLLDLTIASMLVLSSCNSNKLPISLSGSIPLLVNSITNDNINIISIQAKLDAISTLHNLSTCPQTIQSIVSSGLISALLRLINTSEKCSVMVEKSMGLLEDIVCSSEDAVCEAAESEGGIRLLVDTIEESSGQCRENAVRILLEICKSCREKYRGLILKEGVVPGLLELSVEGTWRGKDMARELLLLLRECSGFSNGGGQCCKYEILERVMQEIDEAGERVEGRTLRMVEEMIAKLNSEGSVGR